jgi:hypothetical protein
MVSQRLVNEIYIYVQYAKAKAEGSNSSKGARRKKGRGTRVASTRSIVLVFPIFLL